MLTQDRSLKSVIGRWAFLAIIVWFGVQCCAGAHGQEIKIDEYVLSGQYFSCSEDKLKDGRPVHCGVFTKTDVPKTKALEEILERNKGYIVFSVFVETKIEQYGLSEADGLHSKWLVVVLKKERKE